MFATVAAFPQWHSIICVFVLLMLKHTQHLSLLNLPGPHVWVLHTHKQPSISNSPALQGFALNLAYYYFFQPVRF